MKTAILIVESALGEKTVFDGKYVKVYDPHDGEHGKLIVTADLQDAHHYPDFAEAALTWRCVNRNHPTRPDGKPNRPLAAFTCEFVKIP